MHDQDFDDLYGRAFSRLTAQVYALCGSREDAADCVQEAFVRAWSHRGELDRAGYPEAWVRTVAYRLAVNRWRHGRRQTPLPDDVAHTSDGHAAADNRVDLQRALLALPPKQREAIVLHHLAGLPVSDVARQLDAPEGTVKAWLSRGRRLLADELSPTVELSDIAADGSAPPRDPAEVRRLGQRRRSLRRSAGVLGSLVLAVVVATAAIRFGVAGILGRDQGPQASTSTVSPSASTSGPSTPNPAPSPTPTPSARLSASPSPAAVLDAARGCTYRAVDSAGTGANWLWTSVPQPLPADQFDKIGSAMRMELTEADGQTIATWTQDLVGALNVGDEPQLAQLLGNKNMDDVAAGNVACFFRTGAPWQVSEIDVAHVTCAVCYVSKFRLTGSDGTTMRVAMNVRLADRISAASAFSYTLQ